MGVTGNIGSGKSTVCKIFEALGVPVIYADQVGRKLLETDQKLQNDIVRLLGSESYRNEEPDRAYIASRVFSDPALLDKLNQLVHPLVQKEVQDWFGKQDPFHPYAIEEAALLIESRGYKQLDRLILVTAPESLRIHRVMKRDGVTMDKVKERIVHQMPEYQKRMFCDYLIVNDSEQLLIPQVVEIHQKLMEIIP